MTWVTGTFEAKFRTVSEDALMDARAEYRWTQTRGGGPKNCIPRRTTTCGLYDMAGNVWKSTSDFFSPRHTPVRAKPCCTPGNPHIAVRPQTEVSSHPHEASARRVIKGGSHLCAPNYGLRHRPVARQGEAVDTSTCHLGFRCVHRPNDASSVDIDGAVRQGSPGGRSHV